MLAIVNYTLEEFIVCSAAQFSKRRLVWRNEMASMAASYECFQSLSGSCVTRKFRRPYKKSGSESKNMTDFAPEVAK